MYSTCEYCGRCIPCGAYDGFDAEVDLEPLVDCLLLRAPGEIVGQVEPREPLQNQSSTEIDLSQMHQPPNKDTTHVLYCAYV